MRVCYKCGKEFSESKNNEANMCPYCGASQEPEKTTDQVNGTPEKGTTGKETTDIEAVGIEAVDREVTDKEAIGKEETGKEAAGKGTLSLRFKILAAVIVAAVVIGGGCLAARQLSQSQVSSQEELSEEQAAENMEETEENTAEFAEKEARQADQADAGQEDTQDAKSSDASEASANAGEASEDETEEEAQDENTADSEGGLAEEASADSEQAAEEASYSVDDTVTGIMYASTAINVRSGPSSAYEAIGTLSSNAEVKITGRADTGWYRILFNGGEGFVSDRYLTAEKAETASNTETTASSGNETAQTAQAAEETGTQTAAEQTPAESAGQETAQAGSGTQQTETTTSGSYQSQVVALVNAQRSANGLGQLTENSLLASAAQTRAEEHASVDSLYVNGQHHTRPDGRSWATAMDDVGYSYTSAAENLAQGQTTPEQVVSDWMNSQGHKANILNAGYTEIGVGYAVSASGTVYWVQLFATP